MRQRNIDTDVSAQPWNWSYYADQIWLFPVPDAVYILRLSHLRRLDALTSYTDTNDWMTHGEELIRTRAKWDLLFHSLKDYQGAQVMKQAENDALRNLRSKSEAKIATGTMSFDESLVATGNYNINWE
jgi:hypothetical protein